jgi:hypothetical protein
MIFQRLIKQSQSFETIHATAKPLSILSKRHQARYAKAEAAVYTSSFLYHYFAQSFFSFPTPFEIFINSSFDEYQ